ncbi:hypothetical protein BKA56DRAFT_619066 [Ilyonectria sp. MPI-CAGE-AT-0026]|nr:hypothetical protein BKA56DRAFT_619066 [Ilyonectria sp. MPI-CAGE-AT-0026]
MDPETKAQKLELIASQPPTTLPNVRIAAASTILEETFHATTLLTDGGKGRIVGEEELSEGALLRFHSTFSLWICNHAAVERIRRPKYLELAFREDLGHDMKELALGFWKDRINFPGWKDFGPPNNHGDTRSVYVPAELAHYRGYLVASIMGNTASATALFVMFYGLRNPRMCECCARKYATTTTESGEHVLGPFADCVSYSKALGGSCANCIWEGHQDCTWKFLNRYLPAMKLDELSELPMPGGIRRLVEVMTAAFRPGALNPTSCPRITCKLTGLPLGPEDKEDAVKEANEELEARYEAKLEAQYLAEFEAQYLAEF